MKEAIYQINDVINGIVWGPYMIFLLVGVGIYLSIRMGFLQIFKFGISGNIRWGKRFQVQKEMGRSLRQRQD